MVCYLNIFKGKLSERRGRKAALSLIHILLVDGVDTGKKGAPLQEIRRKVGLVFQYPEDQFFEETVFKEVAFAPRNLGVEAVSYTHLDVYKRQDYRYYSRRRCSFWSGEFRFTPGGNSRSSGRSADSGGYDRIP